MCIRDRHIRVCVGCEMSCDRKVRVNLQEIGNESNDVISTNKSSVVDERSNVFLSSEREREREREREKFNDHTHIDCCCLEFICLNCCQ